MTVGGGIRNIDDIENVLQSGADKVSMNTMAINDPSLINESAKIFGSSTIVVAIEYLKDSSNNYLAFTDNGREHTGIDIVEWIKKVQDLGAGEIILTSIERDGTGKGFDLELISLISKEINIPLIVNGGPAELNDINQVMKIENIDGLALGSILHYSYIKNNTIANDDYNSEGNIDFITKNLNYNKFGNESIKSIKKYLISKKLYCRY